MNEQFVQKELNFRKNKIYSKIKHLNKLILFVMLFFTPLIFAGQRMSITLMKDINKNITFHVKNAQCIDYLNKLAWNSKTVIEESNAWSCLVKNSEFDLEFELNGTDLADYHIIVAGGGSKIKQTYINPNLHFIINTQFVEHIGVIEDQDYWNVSIHPNESHWMADMADQLQNKPLDQVILPGTHDSATYDISKYSKIFDDGKIPAWVKYIENKLSYFFGSYIAGWSKNQPLNITQQLNNGMRYFDLRLCETNQQQIYACHGMLSDSFTNILKQVKQFAMVPSHSKEIIILDINHLYNVNNEQAATMIANQLGDFLISNSWGPSVTLGQLWQLHKNIIVFYKGSHASFLWPESMIYAPWPDDQTVKPLLKHLQTYLNDRDKKKLFVLQTVLTPNGDVIESGINPLSSSPKSIYEYTASYRPIVHDWLNKHQSELKKNGNIITEDESENIWLVKLARELDSK